MRIRCENYWFRLHLEGVEISADLDFDSITERIDCPEVATAVVTDDHDGEMNVCENCAETIRLTNWLHTPEGQAALDEQDWEIDD